MLEYFFKTAGQVNTKNNLFSVSPMDARFFFPAFSLYVIVLQNQARWIIYDGFCVNSSCRFVLASVTQSTGSIHCSSDQILLVIPCFFKVMRLMQAPAGKSETTKMPRCWITPPYNIY